ncbi:SLAM family member 8 [Colossoma macropomum]|uniref:SLAM family member 8 n=1 Tax=Colossoma macropomum TaxID=42526 RepID=UPI001864A0BF|nr:SLAM family member 8 [Colossoma macropomum]
MRICYGYHVLYSGTALLLLCYGLCVWADENTVTERRAAGSSFILPLGHPKESVSFAEWRYEGKTFAVYEEGVRITDELRFNERLKVGSDYLSVEVTDLQLQDSGSYSIVADKTEGQLPTKTITLTVYGMLNVEIKSNQIWVEAKNSCEVHLLCKAREAEKVSYTWSGYKTDSGAELNFTLSPAEGDVTLTCTAANNYSNNDKTTKVTCNPGKTQTGTTNSSVLKDQYIWIAAGGGAALFLLLAIIAVSCWWKSHKDRCSPDSGNTVYADVNDITVRKDKRSESINVASIYETVDELRVTSDKPQTLYDKVTFARPTPLGPSTSSPYQVVL